MNAQIISLNFQKVLNGEFLKINYILVAQILNGADWCPTLYPHIPLQSQNPQS